MIIGNETRLVIETESLDPYETTLAGLLNSEDFSEAEISEIIEALEQTGVYRADDATHGVWLSIKAR